MNTRLRVKPYSPSTESNNHRAEPARSSYFPAGFLRRFRKTYVPRLADVMMSFIPSPFMSATTKCEPTPDRLLTRSGTNSAAPGTCLLRTVRNTYSTGSLHGSGSE
jgi:hypothetical protein